MSTQETSPPETTTESPPTSIESPSNATEPSTPITTEEASPNEPQTKPKKTPLPKAILSVISIMCFAEAFVFTYIIDNYIRKIWYNISFPNATIHG